VHNQLKSKTYYFKEYSFMTVNQSIIPDIKALISTAKEKAIRAVDTERTLLYWNIGRRIFEEEQAGKD
jgi:hypothetical protein